MVTTVDSHRDFYIELDKREVSASPSFLHDEVDYFLYSAYLTLIKQKFTGNNKLQQPFETSVKRISDLQGLIKNVEINGVSGDIYAKNECKFEISNIDSVMFPVSCVFKYNDRDVNSVMIVDHEVIGVFRQTDINNPWIPVPAGIMEDDNILVCIDPLKLSDMPNGFPKLILTYIKFPEKPDYTKPNQVYEVNFVDEIVSLAVDYALDNIEAQRIQIHTQLTQNKE